MLIKVDKKVEKTTCKLRLPKKVLERLGYNYSLEEHDKYIILIPKK